MENKYDPLEQILSALYKTQEEVIFSFAKIEEIIHLPNNIENGDQTKQHI